MCGIMGAYPRTPLTTRMLPFLAWEMENRGDDSWGVTDGTLDHIVKKIGPITQSFEVPNWHSLLYHTRKASCGAKTIPNQHPFTFEQPEAPGTYIIGVHNGCLVNHEQLNKKHNRNFEVDSMHIFANIAEGIETKEIDGWGAIAYYDNGVLCFAKFNGGDLHIFRLDSGEFVWASTERCVRKAADIAGAIIATEFDIKTERQYYVRENDGGPLELVDHGPMSFGFRYKTYSTTPNRSYFDHKVFCQVHKSWVCECQGDAEYPWRAPEWSDQSRPFAHVASGHGNSSAASSASSANSPASKSGTPPTGNSGKAESSPRTSGGQLIGFVPAGPVRPKIVEAVRDVLKHVGQHSQRKTTDGKRVCHQCKGPVIDFKSQLVCIGCFNRFDSASKNRSMGLKVLPVPQEVKA